MRTDPKSITNPYTKAKALELIAVFMYVDEKKKELMPEFNNSVIVRNKLMETLITFYVQIEFSGSSSMFYTKFKYRYDCAVIF